MSAFASAEEYDPLGLGLMLLREDPQFRRIPISQRVPLVEAALEDGRTIAARIARLWGSDPALIAARREIPVVESQSDGGYGSVIVYATYSPKPPNITLYPQAISRLSAFAHGGGGERMAELSMSTGTMNDSDMKSMFIAHELYHHFDCLRGHARISERHAVRIFSVGRWQWTSGLSSLCEIAAGAFAQRLMGLPFHPALLDVLFKQREADHGDYSDRGEEQSHEPDCGLIGDMANARDVSPRAGESM